MKKGDKVKIVCGEGHCLLVGSIGIILGIDDPLIKIYAIVRGGEFSIYQYLKSHQFIVVQGSLWKRWK